ncbi:MAG: acyl--CoA ligase [Mycobacterium sp.]|nr:acyl--CoA ligase [Mycobacterium sp.]
MTADTIAALLARRRHRAGHPLLVCDGARIGYAEAADRSAILARRLIALGVGKNTHVGVLYPNGPDFVVAMLAAARIGAVVVPFSTFSTARELCWQLAHADVAVLLATRRYRSHDYAHRLAEALQVHQLDLDVFTSATPQLRHILFDATDRTEHTECADAATLAAMEADVDGCDPLTIVYTSGSTGTPKGAVHTHAALLEHQANLNEIRGLRSDDVLFSNSPFFWIGGFAFSLLATLVAGSTLLCSSALDPADTLDLLEAERPTITNGFAAGVTHLANHPSFRGRDLSMVRRGNLYPIMAADARPADPELRHNMLGLTEAGSVVLICADESDQPEHRRGSFGRPAPGFETRVVDPTNGTDVELDTVGELWLRGSYLMQRYHRHSREDCFDADGWFHTGDMVRVDGEGFYYFLGRAGSMIKTAGANVSPAEVEKVLARLTGGSAHVVGLPDRDRGQLVAAVIAVDDAADFDPSGLRALLSAELSAYKIPRKILAISRSEVPLMSSGKVDIRVLTMLFDD